MNQELLAPKLIVEVSWEVCNKVGGIYTVLSTRAKRMQSYYKDQLLFIGPDFADSKENPLFQEDAELLKLWKKQAESDGFHVRIGRWNIPGQPMAILVDFSHYYAHLPKLYAKMWEKFQVESHAAYGDYGEACCFAWASAEVIEHLVCHKAFAAEPHETVAHFNEWTTGMGALHTCLNLPHVATLFTTHATSIGRSICGNNKPLYGQLTHYSGDQMARELNMVSKHSLEKQCAHAVDCFTTVSSITAIECAELLDKPVDVVLPNGFEPSFVPVGAQYDAQRQASRALLLEVANKLTGATYRDEETLILLNSGRYEFRNKGIDLFIDALSRLKSMELPKEKRVVAFVMVPADVAGPRADLLARMAEMGSATTALEDATYTHRLNNIHYDNIVNQMQWVGVQNQPDDRVQIIFVPVYLNGKDGIFNCSYYDLLPAIDITLFPSYYEPWGYTPLESIAFGVPTVTTDLAGFGRWAQELIQTETISQGVQVVQRTDENSTEVSAAMAKLIQEFSFKSPAEVQQIRNCSIDTAKEADWAHFLTHYQEAYSVALKKAKMRVEQ